MSIAIADLSEKTEKAAPVTLHHQEKLVPQVSNGFLDDTVWEAFQAQLEANRQAAIAELEPLTAENQGK